MSPFYIRPDGTIEFRKCLALARRARAGHRSMEALPIPRSDRAPRTRLARIRSYMHGVRYVVAEEQGLFEETV